MLHFCLKFVKGPVINYVEERGWKKECAVKAISDWLWGGTNVVHFAWPLDKRICSTKSLASLATSALVEQSDLEHPCI